MEANRDLCALPCLFGKAGQLSHAVWGHPEQDAQRNNPLWGEMGTTEELPEAKQVNNVPLWRRILDFHGFIVELILRHNQGGLAMWQDYHSLRCAHSQVKKPL